MIYLHRLRAVLLFTVECMRKVVVVYNENTNIGEVTAAVTNWL